MRPFEKCETIKSLNVINKIFTEISNGKSTIDCLTSLIATSLYPISFLLGVLRHFQGLKQSSYTFDSCAYPIEFVNPL